MATEDIDYKYNYLYARSLREMSYIFNFQNNDSAYDENAKPVSEHKQNYHVDYKYNSYGYRCDEFNNQKIMFLGCSNTYGLGSHVENTWPDILSKKLNMDYINLGTPGDSAQAQIIKAFQFFKEFYNPEYIIAFLPVFRIEAPKVKNILMKKKEKNKDGYEIFQHFFNNDNNNILKYAKAPYNLDEILPREFPIFYNFMFIQMLVQYCESNNIKLYWSTYEIEKVSQVKQFLNLKNPKNYFEVNFFKADYLKKYDCHKEFQNDPGFDFASDNSHLGLHYHLHLAELIHSIMV
jgi:hypothetical protein